MEATNNNSSEALNHLYSCSRWAGYDPEKVLENFLTGEKKAYAYMKKNYPVEEDIPYGPGGSPSCPRDAILQKRTKRSTSGVLWALGCLSSSTAATGRCSAS